MNIFTTRRSGQNSIQNDGKNWVNEKQTWSNANQSKRNTMRRKSKYHPQNITDGHGQECKRNKHRQNGKYKKFPVIIIRGKERKAFELDRKLVSLPLTWPFALGLVERLLVVLQLGPGQRAARKSEIWPREPQNIEAFTFAGRKLKLSQL